MIRAFTVSFALFFLFTCSETQASIPHPHAGEEDQLKANAKANTSFFDAAPEIHLRDFHPDRPGSTNTPYTIDAGHFQLEMEMINYTRLPNGQGSQLNYPNPNLRIGLSNWLELDLAFVPHLSLQELSGRGDLNLKLKRNFFGNDGGPVAWALMPGLKIPTHAAGLGNRHWEPYLMIPFSVTLQNKWAISLMPELDLRENASGQGMHTELITPFTFGRHLFSIFDAYAELVSHSSNDLNATWLTYFGFGFTARVAKNAQIDAGMNLGLNEATPALNPFAGWVQRW